MREMASCFDLVESEQLTLCHDRRHRPTGGDRRRRHDPRPRPRRCALASLSRRRGGRHRGGPSGPGDDPQERLCRPALRRRQVGDGGLPRAEPPPSGHRRVAQLEAFGRFVARLGGAYIPGVDMGTSVDDLAMIGTVVPDVSCDFEDPSPATALGVLRRDRGRRGRRWRVTARHHRARAGGGSCGRRAGPAPGRCRVPRAGGRRRRRPAPIPWPWPSAAPPSIRPASSTPMRRPRSLRHGQGHRRGRARAPSLPHRGRRRQ